MNSNLSFLRFACCFLFAVVLIFSITLLQEGTASRNAAPDAPDLANTYVPWEGAPPFGATAQYLLGLRHAAAHIPQIADALAQARAERWRRTRRGRLLLRLRRRGAEADPMEATDQQSGAVVKAAVKAEA